MASESPVASSTVSWQEGLVGAVLEGEARDAEDMGDVRDGRPLANLAGVQSGGKHKDILKTR
jgi:hypothetical protein